jgi:hypothetical protein
VEFDFDTIKSEANRTKHGLDFKEAKAMWDDPDAIGFPTKSDDEDRFAMLAELNNRIWVAFYTHRAGRIRIVSVRRARTNERKLYES